MNEHSKALMSAKFLFNYCNGRPCRDCAFYDLEVGCRIQEIVGKPSAYPFDEHPAVRAIRKDLRKKSFTPSSAMTEKIKDLLIANPNAGFADLQELFGTVTRSIVVIFYRESARMYGKGNSLTYKRKVKNEARWEKTYTYFKNNPDATLRQASRDLGCRYGSLVAYLNSQRKKGKVINYRRLVSSRGKLYGKTKVIADFFRGRPDATVKECAAETGINIEYVSQRFWALQKKGLLQKRRAVDVPRDGGAQCQSGC